ncbi:hypothetical protein [Caballeronia humi]|uniref:Uncharacterized protein n=1 Tax=Caballeronia humi TaxID=326474 RepID=A0A158IHC7_9BURK|nr:hypothetical protein [Caballeronia humi]SAL55978.1 hypothetical protein AWB65_04832 [Caballeronia humi]
MTTFSIWLTAICIALVATCTIALTLPISPEDELSRATAPEAMLKIGVPALPHWLEASASAVAQPFPRATDNEHK